MNTYGMERDGGGEGERERRGCFVKKNGWLREGKNGRETKVIKREWVCGVETRTKTQKN